MELDLEVNDLRLGSAGTVRTTARNSAVLQRTDAGIILTVAWEDRSSPPEWLRKSRIEETLVFADSRGHATLLGCRISQLTSAAFKKRGSATIRVERVVLDAPLDGSYAEINAVRSRIPGLRSWAGITSWTQTLTAQGDGAHTVSLTSKQPSSISLGSEEGIDLDLVPAWSMSAISSMTEEATVKDIVWCESRSVSVKSWKDHLEQHRALRDLIALSRWNRENLTPARVMRDDSTSESLSGETHPAEWLPVVDSRTDIEEKPPWYAAHLLPLGDLGATGVRSWMDLRRDFPRALDPLISSIEIQTTSRPVTLLAHTGPGIEALGYYLLIEDNLSKKLAKSATLTDRMDRILADLDDSLPFSDSNWSQDVADTYNGIKHANRVEPNPLDIMNAWREITIVMRAWVAIRLGVPTPDVKSRLADEWQRLSNRAI